MMQKEKYAANIPDTLPASEIRYPEELVHLAMIRDKLEEALLKKEYQEEKNYMVQFRGEIDPREMFQNELVLKQIDRTGAFAVRMREQLLKLKGSPYFARIDFQEAESKEAERYYIGRFHFYHEHRLWIVDWRAPLAGMFYDDEIGPAGYDTPDGRVCGTLTRKRQFKIRDGRMEYALESALQIQDDILQRELSRTSDEKMKTIIATIQKEQNQMIRRETRSTLIIQGAAGSGKTSVALHRIAYLLYRFKEKLSAQQVAVLSPNRIFGDYIANVLPELGEEPVCQCTLAEIAQVQLEGVIGFIPEGDPLEITDEKEQERIRWKSTLDFVQQMDAFLSQPQNSYFIPADCTFGAFTVPKEQIGKRFMAYGKYPVKQRLEMISADLYAQFQGEQSVHTAPKRSAIKKRLLAMLTVKDTFAFYQQFYQQMGRPDLLVLPDRHILEWADVYPFLYLHAAMEGLKESGVIKHLVVDEMQDYTPIQYAVLEKLFPCQKTILGDFGQRLHPYHLHTLKDLLALYDEAEFMTLKKSYRSTYEIMQFANQLRSKEEATTQAMEAETVLRHGPVPALRFCHSVQDEMKQLGLCIHAFMESTMQTMAIITKTNQAAAMLYEQLSKQFAVHLLQPESSRFAGGISITSVQMSKGLEFDQVLLMDVDQHTYQGDYDKGLLYIACTRAMHQLTLFYTGELSPLLKGAL